MTEQKMEEFLEKSNNAKMLDINLKDIYDETYIRNHIPEYPAGSGSWF